MPRNSILLFCLLINPLLSFAQNETKLLLQGQEQFDNLLYQESLNTFQESFEKNGDEVALQGIIRSYLELGIQNQFNGKATESQSAFSLGLSHAETLVEMDATDKENRLLRGLLFVYNSQIENARMDYEYVQLNHPNYGRTYYYLWTLLPLEGMDKINHPYVNEALTLDPNIFELHQELGSYYGSLNMTTQAIESYEKALEISPKNYKANFSLGQVYWSLGDLEKMRHHFSNSIEYFPEFGYGQMLLGGVELMSGNTTEAVSLIKKALKNNPQTEAYLPMFKENFPVLNNYNLKAKTLPSDSPIDADGYPRFYQEAVALAQKFDYYGAADKFHQCQDNYDNYPQHQPQWTISILSWLSHCYRELGFYANAIHSSKKALDLSQTNHITTDQASLAANLAMIYFGWGDYPSAITYARQSLDLLIKNNQDELLYDAYINLGVYHRKWHQYDSAVIYHKQALALEIEGSNYKTVLAYKELALSYSAKGQMKKAKENINQMFKLADKTDLNDQESMINLGAAQVFYKLGDYDKANDYCMKAADNFIQLQQVTPIHPSLIDFASTFSGILTNQNKIDLAYTNLQSLNYTLINQIQYYFPAMSDQGKLIFYRDASEYFERFNSFAIENTSMNQIVLNQMLENQLLKKGLLFNNESRFNRMMASTENNEASQLFDQLVASKNLVARSVSLDEEDLQSRGIVLKELQKDIDSLQTAISQLGIPMEESRIYEEGLIRKINKELAPNEAAIEVIRFNGYNFQFGGQFIDKVFYVALIQKGNSDDIEYVLLDDGLFMEQKGYSAYVNAVNYEIIDKKSYSVFWESIQEKLNGIGKVYFAGDGVFHKININTLYNPKTGKYLIDELDVRLITSTRDIIKKTAKLPRNGEVVLVGFPAFDTESKSNPDGAKQIFTTRAFTSLEYLEPLPGTYDEVKTIEKILEDSKWESTVLTGESAIEENIKSISNPTVLHIATHGYFEESEKYDNALLYSGLFLTGATTKYKNKTFEGEDGILTAYEAMHLNLQKTQMVVLSACETGMGRIENGEGVYGLQRAFLIAGANSVVMSMWKVNDQTTMELMTHFYTNLEDAKDKHIAFRQAQLDLKEKYSSPKYWGAFNIVGK